MTCSTMFLVPNIDQMYNYKEMKKIQTGNRSIVEDRNGDEFPDFANLFFIKNVRACGKILRSIGNTLIYFFCLIWKDKTSNAKINNHVNINQIIFSWTDLFRFINFGIFGDGSSSTWQCFSIFDTWLLDCWNKVHLSCCWWRPSSNVNQPWLLSTLNI